MTLIRNANSTIDRGSQTTDGSRAPVPTESPRANNAIEQWYFRIDGHEYGPSSRDQLEHFLKPPRLCTSMEVMCTKRDGFWFLILRDETLETVLNKVGIRVKSATTSRNWPTPSRTSALMEKLSDWSDQFKQKVSRHGTLLLIFLMFLVGNGWLAYGIDRSDARGREILSRYEQLRQTVGQFASGQRSGDDWLDVAAKSQIELKPLIHELSRSADIHHPNQKLLLFAGRDHLLKLFDAKVPPSETSPEVKAVDRYLQLVKEQLSP